MPRRAIDLPRASTFAMSSYASAADARSPFATASVTSGMKVDAVAPPSLITPLATVAPFAKSPAYIAYSARLFRCTMLFGFIVTARRASSFAFAKSCRKKCASARFPYPASSAGYAATSAP